jgi:omega-amidase
MSEFAKGTGDGPRQDLVVWGLQLDIAWENPLENVARVDAFLRQPPSSAPPDLLVLPELWSTGFTMNPAQCAEPHGGPAALAPAQHAMRRWADATGAAVVGSIAVSTPDGFRNRLYFVPPSDSGDPSWYDKWHLFAPAGEHLHYTRPASPEEALVILRWRGWRIRLVICYDLRFPVFCRWTPAYPYDALVAVANWPAVRSAAWAALLRARAIENQCAVLGVNRVGADSSGHPHDGLSACFDAQGEVISHLDPHAAGWIAARFDAERQQAFRMKLPFLQDGDAFSWPPFSAGANRSANPDLPNSGTEIPRDKHPGSA